LTNTTRNRQTSKRRGAETQQAVADYYRLIWPGATSAGAGASGQDILNVPLDIEVKARADFNPTGWIRQQRKRGAKGGHVVLRPNGIGVESVGDWLVIRRLEDDTGLLWAMIQAGKDPLTMAMQIIAKAEADGQVRSLEQGIQGSGNGDDS
jgi:hypothetical protein